MSNETSLDEQEYASPRPQASGRRPPPLRPSKPQSPPPADGGHRSGGAQRLEAAAADLLYLATHIRQIETPRNQSDFLHEMEDLVHTFRCKIERSFSEEMVDDACYLLCSTLDDLIINETGWGRDGAFRRKGVTSSIYEKKRPGAWGDEFFDLVNEKFKRDPTRYLGHLKLAYLCLSVGFQGKYRTRQAVGPFRSAEDERADIWKKLQNQYNNIGFDGRLARLLHIAHEDAKPPPAPRPRPLWAVPLAMLGLLAFFLTIHQARIGVMTDDLAKRYFGELAIVPPEKIGARPQESQPSYQGLQELIRNQDKLEALYNTPGIRIAGGALFDLGDATIRPEYGEALNAIARWLKSERGGIHVYGHTDATPVADTGKGLYHSNLELSQARAEAVKARLLELGVEPDRIVEVKGCGDTKLRQDILPRNAGQRRVEITLQTPGGY